MLTLSANSEVMKALAGKRVRQRGHRVPPIYCSQDQDAPCSGAGRSLQWGGEVIAVERDAPCSGAVMKALAGKRVRQRGHRVPPIYCSQDQDAPCSGAGRSLQWGGEVIAVERDAPCSGAGRSLQ